LLEAGVAVRLLYRHPGFPGVHEGRDLEIARGDIRDPRALREAMRGVDQVFHLAALTRSLTRRQMMATNVLGTRGLLEAARAEGLAGRFVLCSSLAVVGPSRSGVPLDEDAPEAPLTWYGESKRAAEALVRAAARELPVTIVRPPAVYGPRDKDFLALFQGVQKGLAPIVGDAGARYSMVHARDLAEAMAALPGAPATEGGTYFATHPEIVTQEGMLQAAEAALGKTGRRLRLPVGLMRLLGHVVDVGSEITRRPSVLGDQRMREVANKHWVCDGRRLQESLDWRPRLDLAAGFADTVRWYREAGKLA